MLQRCGSQLGLAYQIQDDVLDVTASSAMLGKTAGKDVAAQKSTYVQLMGLDAARARALALLDEAAETLHPLDDQAAPLRALLATFRRRQH